MHPVHLLQEIHHVALMLRLLMLQQAKVDVDVVHAARAAVESK